MLYYHRGVVFLITLRDTVVGFWSGFLGQLFWRQFYSGSTSKTVPNPPPDELVMPFDFRARSVFTFIVLQEVSSLSADRGMDNL